MYLLEEFLRTFYRFDVLVPCVDKRPLFSHKNGEWTWDRWDDFCDAHPCKRVAGAGSWMCCTLSKTSVASGQVPHDVGVLLRQVCVIDVDDAALATEMERRFEELHDCPCVSTARGRHYWLERSVRADDDGYFDGASQVVKGIDFKSVCRNGTSGFVVVPPSSGKKWVRSIALNATLPVISDALLEAVARPTVMSIPPAVVSLPPVRYRRLRFVQTCQFLTLTCDADADVASTFQYLRPFFEEPWDFRMEEDDSIPVPYGDAHTFTHLLFACRTDDVYELLDGACIARMIDLSDFLGVPMVYRRCFTTPFGRALQMLDLATHVDRRWACELIRDRNVTRALFTAPSTTSGCVWSDTLVWLWSSDTWNDMTRHVTFRTCAAVKRDQRALFHTTPAAFRDDTVVFEHPTTAIDNIPGFIKYVLLRYPNVVLAGGAALHHCTQTRCPENHAAVSDWDLFIWGVSVDKCSEILEDMKTSMIVPVDHRLEGCYVTKNAVTFNIRVPDGDVIAVQVVLRTYDNPAQILYGFDIDPARFAIGLLGTPSLQAVATPSAVRAVSTGVYYFNPATEWSASACARILKYHAKGYDALIPCTRRELFIDGVSRGTPRCLAGICTLYQLETTLNYSRTWYKSLDTRIDIRSIKTVFRQLSLAKSDYETVHSTVHNIKHMFGTARRWINVLLLRGTDPTHSTGHWNVSWTPCDTRRDGSLRSMAPAPPNFGRLYSMDALMTHLFHDLNVAPTHACSLHLTL